jgi:hypothetical protein
MEVGGQSHSPAASPPRKEMLYPFYRRVGGPQGRSGRVRKMSTPTELDLWTIQQVASGKERNTTY